MIILCFHIPIVQAGSVSYEIWKQRQERHDQRLKQQSQTLYAKNADIIYLSNPTALSQSGTHTMGQQIKININQASEQEIVAKLEGIGPKRAKDIIAHRKKHGPFHTIYELKQVKGIGEKTFERNKTRLSVSP